MNITLIGMPGSGKSYVGKKLAEDVGYTFIDLDRVMEETYGLSLQQILDTEGEELFLRKQADDVISYTLGKTNTVISPGGSIVYSEDAMEYLRTISTLVYLAVPFSVIEQRIGTLPRGIVGIKNKTLTELYKERTLLYEKWSTISFDGNTPAELLIEKIKMSFNLLQ